MKYKENEETDNIVITLSFVRITYIDVFFLLLEGIVVFAFITEYGQDMA